MRRLIDLFVSQDIVQNVPDIIVQRVDYQRYEVSYHQLIKPYKERGKVENTSSRY